MIEKVTTLSKGYQITLPSVIRKAMGLRAGDQITLVGDGNAFTIQKTETKEEWRKRFLKNMKKEREEDLRRMTPEQRKIAEMTAGWTMRQYHEYFDDLPETKAYIKEKYGV